MADINITKGGPTIWPWVLGLLLLALMIWALTEVLGEGVEINIPNPIADTVAVRLPEEVPVAFESSSAALVGGRRATADTPGAMGATLQFSVIPAR